VITAVQQLPPVGKSDHCGIRCHLGVTAARVQAFKTVKDWNRADFAAMNEAVASTDWHGVLADLNVDETSDYHDFY